MSAPVDILERGRELARRIEDADGDPSPDAETVRLLCDEIEAHRRARDAMAPGVAERLTRYRAALATGAASRFHLASMRDMTTQIEDMAHAMLVAEREPEVKR